MGGWLTEPWVTVIGTGVTGGFTTFSTASLEAVRLLSDRRWTAAVVDSLGTLVGAVAFASLGILLARG
ncbi:CrcB family protein [Microbacterium hydrothermale]|uniref:CrcB family protein n=1 Tax=Microbacterium hydrothermale TaxID=857427 RepID=UPI003B8338A5